jgi:Collagen triple helix repeat (20 copies)
MTRMPLRSMRSFACFASLLVLISGCLFGQATPPSADTFVSSLTPRANYGPSIILVVQQGANSYLQFNLSALPVGAHVSKATLRLFVDGVLRSGSFDVYQLNAPWNENTLTYNTPPPALGTSATGGNPVSVTSATMNQFLLIDITSTVQGWVGGGVANNGVALSVAGDGKGIFSFDSKESLLTGNGPELEIVLDGPVGPAGPQGPAGPTGPQGVTGSQGSSGPQGAAGAQGTMGLQGIQGPQGIPGAQGPQGDTGPQGPQGLSGPLLPDLVYTDQNNIFLQSQLFQGSVALAPTAPATSSQSFPSNPFDLQASVFDGSKSQLQTFRWLAEPVVSGNSGPLGTLNLLFGQGGSFFKETGLSFSTNGTLSLRGISSPQDLLVSPGNNLLMQTPADALLVTGNDFSQTLGHDWTVSTGREMTFSAGGDSTWTSANNLTLFTGRDTFINSNNSMTLSTGNMTVTDAGNQQTTVGSASTLSVGSALTTTVGQNLSETAGAAATLQAGTTLLLKSGNDTNLEEGGNLAIKTDGSVQLRSGLDVNLQAGSAMSLRSSAGMTIESATPITLKGDVNVTGNLSKGGGSFKIDDPLDPANKYLYHSFVESPDMMNVYNGNVTTDAHGLATIVLPEYFEALNRDFRYQLTVIGQFAQAIVASEIHGNRFTIRTSKKGVRVSWQVTGIRQDAYANVHRIPTEVDKPLQEQGHYLHPEAFGVSPELAVGAHSAAPTAEASVADGRGVSR